MGSNAVVAGAAACEPECSRYEAGHRVCAELVREAWESAAEFVRVELRAVDSLECTAAVPDGSSLRLWRHLPWADVVTVGQDIEWHPRLQLVRVATGPDTWTLYSVRAISDE